MPAADSLTEFHEQEKDFSPIRKSATCRDRSSSKSPRSGIVEGSHEDPASGFTPIGISKMSTGSRLPAIVCYRANCQRWLGSTRIEKRSVRS
jgi:hypothetical protein